MQLDFSLYSPNAIYAAFRTTPSNDDLRPKPVTVYYKLYCVTYYIVVGLEDAVRGNTPLCTLNPLIIGLTKIPAIDAPTILIRRCHKK